MNQDALRSSLNLAPCRATDVRFCLTAGGLSIPASAVQTETPGRDVLDLMLAQPELHAVAVLQGSVPVGMIHRPALLDRFIGMYGREIYGRKPCLLIMDASPLIVDQSVPIQELSELVVNKGKQAFTQGFIVTANGNYLGLGSGFDLMREVTRMQIVAARYANPLTGLPGNVPIQEYTERLLEEGKLFHVAYCDLDQFKPYNDVYGFRRGDDMIRLLARLLRDDCSEEQDFVGHVGGDDFVVLFRSPDWERRCRSILSRFAMERLALFDALHVDAGGYSSEDRRGQMVFNPLVGLSIGVVQVDPGFYHHFQQVSGACAEAKHMAKKMGGGGFSWINASGHPVGWSPSASAMNDAIRAWGDSRSRQPTFCPGK